MSGLEKKWPTEVAHLPYDLVFKILLLLPAKVLYRLSFVCKTWYNLINSSTFIDAHMGRCETSLVFLTLRPISQRRPNTLCIYTGLGLSERQLAPFLSSATRRYEHDIHYLELFQDGKGKVSNTKVCGIKTILATCNGLVLGITDRNHRLLIINPITRKFIGFPIGTIVPALSESYGFVFDPHKSEYKVIHLFRDDQTGDIGCEVLSLRTGSWRAVDGPSPGLFRCLREAVTTTGALHWLPARRRECSHLVSLGIDDEKFVTRALPVNNITIYDNLIALHDNLVEIGGSLSLVAHATKYRIQVWILKGNEKTAEDWVKQYTINMDRDIGGLIPLFATRNGTKLVFQSSAGSENISYAYDFQDEEMKEIELELEGVRSDFRTFSARFDLRASHLPHQNTLASWVNP